jgi:hypothetical protein
MQKPWVHVTTTYEIAIPLECNTVCIKKKGSTHISYELDHGYVATTKISSCGGEILEK